MPQTLSAKSLVGELNDSLLFHCERTRRVRFVMKSGMVYRNDLVSGTTESMTNSTTP